MALTFTAGTSVESTGSVTSTTVTLPSGLVDGDYTIIFVSLNASSGNITTPAGWTNILADTNTVNGSTSAAHAIFYRKWQSGDTNPSVTTSSGRVAVTPVKVSGADGTTFVNTAAVVNQNASGVTTIAASSITPSSTVLVCSFMGRHASNGVYLTPFSNLSAGMTQIEEANSRATGQTNAGHCIAYQTVTANSATGTRQVDAANTTTGAMGVTFALNEASGGGGPSNETVSPTGIASAEAFGTPSGGSVDTAIYSTFDDGTRGGWTESITGNGTTAITSAAAHDGPFGASANVPATSGDRAALTRSIGPSQSVTIRGWWKVTTEGSSSGSNVPFARLFNGSQRLADVYRQNQQGGANVWLRVTKAAGGSNYTYIPTGYTLPVGTWVYISFTWGLDGIPHLFIDGVEYLNESDAPADFYAATQIDTAWLGSQESGNQGAWAIDTVDVVSRGTPAADEIRNEPVLTSEAFGSPSVTISDPPVDISPPGIASAGAFGSPSISTSLTSSPAGVASAGAFGTPTLSTTLTASPTGIASGQAVGSPSLAIPIGTAPAGIASAQAFGSPTISATLTTSPSGIASAQAVGTPALTIPRAVTVAGIASAEAHGTPTISSTLTSSPAGIGTAETFGNPTIVAGANLSPTGIASAEAVGTPTISATLAVATPGIASAEALGTPTRGGNLPVSVTGIAGGEAFGTPALSGPPAITVNPSGIGSAETFGSLTWSGVLTVSPSGVGTGGAFGTPTVTKADAVSPTGIPSAGAFGIPALSGLQVVGPAGIPSLEAFGLPRWSNVLVTFPSGVPGAGAVSAPSIQTRLTVGPAGIPSLGAVGTPTIEVIVLRVGPVGIGTHEGFGIVRVLGGSSTTPIEMDGDTLSRRYTGRLTFPGNSSTTPNRWEGHLD